MADETRSAASGRDTGHWVEEYECAHCRREVIVALFAAWPEKCPHCGVWGATLRTKGAQRADAADGYGATLPGVRA